MLIESLLIILVIQALFFFIAASFETDKVTDLSYGLTFVIITWFLLLTRKKIFTAQILIGTLISLWGLRLATYLFIRILKIKKDKRFDGIRNNFPKFAFFWVLQTITIWTVMLPSIVVLSSDNHFLTPLTYAGGAVWLIGFIIESVADYQKFRFKLKHKERFISGGIWRYSRYPNYFGEMLCWWGIFLISIPYLSGITWLTIIGPISITFLLLFVTGIPPLEKRYEKKYSKDPEYKKYKENTSLLIPFPPKD